MAENIIQQSVEAEITQSYIDYAMSVIVSRALPDVRDGLKPVQRRILYAMYDMGLNHNAKFKKSAAVVWEVLWKYHPHGDSSVYEAMVRMAQPFSLRYPLIDGQWNFWSIDWDWAAAMRYTEARLTKIAEEMLQDIEQDTVNWRDNYDSSKQEPITVPTKFPNHLCNGTMGIAVGMATNMAPHNLWEVIDASLMLIDNPETDIDEIMTVIKWPDFPTWGIIFDSFNITEVYKRWKGWIIMRGKVHMETDEKKNPVIVVDEVPYQVNKANLVAKIWELVNDRKIDWIIDITDESSKNLIRVVIVVRKGIDPQDVLTQLYKLTELQSNFNVNNVVLVEEWKQPRLSNIKELLEEFVSYRRSIILRRSKYQLQKALDRLHILEWLKKAIDILDDVIATIRWSETRQDAKDSLMNNYEFSDEQSEYILMLRLQTLVGLEIQKILEEINEKKELIEYLTEIINNPKKLDGVVIDELVYIKDEYADDRRTEVSNDAGVHWLETSLRQLQRLQEMQKEDVIYWQWNNNEIKVLYQSRINIVPEDTQTLVYTHNQDRVMVITDKAELVIIRLKDIWPGNIKSKGYDIKKENSLQGNIIHLGLMSSVKFDYLMFLTNQNNIKKVDKALLESFKKFPTTIMGLFDKEEIIQVLKVDEEDKIWIVTAHGIMLLFKESNVRPMWKTAWGVKWITLEEGDSVANMFILKDELCIFVYSEDAGKLVSVEDLKIQKRWQKWLVVAKLKSKEYIKWGFAIDEWSLRVRLKNWEVIDINSNDIRLKNRDTQLDKITDKKIEKIYTLWEEDKEKSKAEMDAKNTEETENS